MAQSNRIETRIGLRGGDEVKKQLEQIGAAGEKAFNDIGKRAAGTKLPTAGDETLRHFQQIGQSAQSAGNQVRASLIAATQGVTTFSGGAAGAAVSSGQMRFALTNLGFQVNDIATSLASGGDAMRVFAQQGGQIVQVFQQGGGVVPVLRAAASAIASMVTPLTLAAGAAVAVGGAFAAVASRAAGSEGAARKFDVQLRAMGKSGQTTGKDLEAASRRLREVGLSAAEGQAAISTALNEGVRTADLERVVKTGAELNAVLGAGSMERFIKAAAQGGEPLRQIAEQLGIIPRGAAAAASALSSVTATTSEMARSVNAVFRQSGQSLVDAQRQAAEQIADLTRRRGTEAEEIQFQLQRRIVDINRQTNRQLADLARQRNEENAKELAAHNKKILDDAQKAIGDRSLVDQIEARVAGSFKAALTPLQEAFHGLNLSWQNFLDRLADSSVVQGLLNGLQSAATGLGQAFQKLAGDIKAANDAAVAVRTTLSSAGVATAQKFAYGGMVYGPGGPRADRVPALLSAGEYIVQAPSVARYGVAFMNALNRGALPINEMLRAAMRFVEPQRLAFGGMVDVMNTPLITRPGGSLARSLPSLASSSGSGSPVFLQIGADAGRIGPMMADREVVRSLKRSATKAKTVSMGRKPRSVGG